MRKICSQYCSSDARHALAPATLSLEPLPPIDATKLQTELGWHPHFTDFREGLAETVDWYRTHQDWWMPDKATTEEKYRKQGHGPLLRGS